MNHQKGKGAIIIPAGSGKTTFSKKYKNVYDIDAFHSLENYRTLRTLYQEVVISKDWNKYHQVEKELIQDKINNLPTPYLLLLHAKEKADLLNIPCLGACKISEIMMNEIAIQRGKKDKLMEKMTRDNWKYTEATICNSHEEIHKYIIKLAKENHINLEL